MEALRERFATLTDVDRAAADGDFVTIDLRATQDGEPVEGAEVTGMSYKVGRGGMLDGLDEALVGMSAGDDTTFTSQLVGGDLVGQDVEVQVTVSQVQQQELPELDDEFAQIASEFDTAEELQADVRERLGRGKRLEQAAAARDAVLEVLLEKVSVPLPETMVTDELNARRQSVEQQLMMAGITMEKYLEDEGQTQEEFEAELDRRVRDAVTAQFLLDEVAKQQEYGVDQAELSEHLVRRAQQSGQDPQEFANHMFEHNHIPELVQEILRGKALAAIVESATVTDASGNVVELKNLRPDGTIGEPEDEPRPTSPTRPMSSTRRPTPATRLSSPRPTRADGRPPARFPRLGGDPPASASPPRARRGNAGSNRTWALSCRPDETSLMMSRMIITSRAGPLPISARQPGRFDSCDGDAQPDGRGEDQIEFGIAIDAVAEPLQQAGKQSATDLQRREPRRTAGAIAPGPRRPDQERKRHPLQVTHLATKCPQR